MDIKDIIKELEERMKTEDPDIIREEVAYGIYKHQGEYTVEDYFSIPDEYRVELIDGVIYDMAAPTDKHQLIGDEIRGILRDYIKKNNGKCITITSPIDVQIDSDNKTMVQPDVIVVCERSKFQNGRVFGAPDLIVEVLSPSTKKIDIFIKGPKYMTAGVKEYWLVDPIKKRVHVYKYEKDEMPVMYTFEQKIPVGIWDDKCEVDFKEIFNYISFLYEE